MSGGMENPIFTFATPTIISGDSMHLYQNKMSLL